MIINLFSIFDPSSISPVQLNWLAICICIIIIPSSIWKINHQSNITFSTINTTLGKEFKIIVPKPSSRGAILILTSLFMSIVVLNALGLVPLIFRTTTHISLTLYFSLPIWIGLSLYGWVNHFKLMLAHLVPQRTPTALIPFIVLIETSRSIIRPLTLAIRLAANIIAGHLLIALIGSQCSGLPLLAGMGAIGPHLALSTLERAVRIIQAYVFSILTALYVAESE